MVYPHGWLDNNGQNDWDYWKTYIQDKNNTIWEATLNIANAADGRKILYDIGPIKKVGQAVKSATIPTGNNIPQNAPVVNDQFSLSDSGGNQLSDAQAEFFKDSVVRDENGNLKVMYHGTSKGGFTVFDTYGSNYGLFGTGSYFTDSKAIGESYTKKGKGILCLLIPILSTRPGTMPLSGSRRSTIPCWLTPLIAFAGILRF